MIKRYGTLIYPRSQTPIGTSERWEFCESIHKLHDIICRKCNKGGDRMIQIQGGGWSRTSCEVVASPPHVHLPPFGYDTLINASTRHPSKNKHCFIQATERGKDGRDKGLYFLSLSLGLPLGIGWGTEPCVWDPLPTAAL